MKEKFYNLINFYQIIIIKNMPFFIAVGIFNIIKLKWAISLEVVDKLIKYIIPFTIAYTTGNLVEKKYGATMSVLASVIFLVMTKSCNILIILLLSFSSSYMIKRIKKDIVLKYFPSMEMLIINLTIPIVSIVVGTVFFYLNQTVELGIDKLLSYFIDKRNSAYFIIGITPIIEVFKVFFLNNFLNHGFLFFLGYEEMIEKGSSLFFLLETNPGPGLGVLLAYYFLKKEKKDILNTLVLESFGGIHEVYFPYILQNLKLLFPLIVGGLTGNLIFYYFNVSLYSIPSPGSMILIFLFTKYKVLYTLLGVFLSILISFISSYYILSRIENNEKNFEDEKIELKLEKKIEKIGIVCIGGVGTSSIGKNFLLNELENQGCLEVKVENYNINEVEDDIQILITHKELRSRVEAIYKDKIIIVLEDYLDKEFYKNFVKKYLIQKRSEKKIEEIKVRLEMNQKGNFDLEIAEEKIEILQEKIGIIIEKKNENEILIKHYPYGVLLRNKEIFLILKLSLETEKINKIKRRIESLEKRELENIEITDNEMDILNLLELEKVLKVEVVHVK